MSYLNRVIRAAAGMLAGSLILSPALAQELPPPDPQPPSRDELVKQIDAVLPSLIGEDNTELARLMLGAKLGPPLSKNFDVNATIRDPRIFGRVRPAIDRDCARTTTESGDPSPDPCIARVGQAAGGGEYKEFSWSKNLGFGDIKFMRRLADGSVKPGELPAVQMSDAAALEKAQAFVVELMGIPREEIVAPDMLPDGARLPVRTLAIGGVDPQGKQTVVEAMKMVQIPRALQVDLKDPASGRELPFVPATGEAYVLMNDDGVWQASVRNWREMAPMFHVDPANAKTRSELISEIADAILAEENYSRIHSLGIRLGILAGEPVAMEGKVVSPMMPSLEVSVAVVPRDPSEEEQARLGPNTAGFTEEIALVRLEDEKSAEGDN